jgi:ankyrin repeat protein
MNMMEISTLLLKFGAYPIIPEVVKPKSDKEATPSVKKYPISKYPIFDSGDSNLDHSARDAFKTAMESPIVSLNGAAYLGNPQILQKTECNDFMDNNQCSLLMKLSFKGHFQIVKNLVKDSNIDLVDHEGNTALVWAIIGGNTKIAKFLLENGANVNGIPILKTGSKEPIVYNSPLSVCAFKNNEEICLYLYENGNLDVNQTLVNGRTALKIAVLMRFKNMVDIILKYGGKVDPSYEVWMENGIISFKKQWLDINPFYTVPAEGFHFFTILGKTIKNNITKRNINRRPSLQEKLIYCSAEDIDNMNEISKMLKLSLNPEGYPKSAKPIISKKRLTINNKVAYQCIILAH